MKKSKYRCWWLCFCALFVTFGIGGKTKPGAFDREYRQVCHPKNQFVEAHAEAAINLMVEFGVPASIILAQAILESKSGTSELALATNNHFGVKCKRKCRRPGHCARFSDDHMDDRFLIYRSVADSFRHHSKVVTSNRYSALPVTCGDSWWLWTDSLQAKGYATSKTYSASLKSIILKNRLYEYDRREKPSYDPEGWTSGPIRWRGGSRP